MPSEDTLHVLIVEKSHEEANHYISILRSADYIVDAKLASDEESLQKYISMRNWDLLLASFDYQDLPANSIFQRIRRAERDIPVILISEGYDPQKLIEGLRLGAEDVVVKDQDQHFLQVVIRALHGIQERRQLREWERKLSLAEMRTQHLMDLSRHPIAIIQEGTYVYCNDACAFYFGYNEPDEMLCLPVIDNIAAKDKDKLKAYMAPIDPKHEIMPFEAIIKTQDVNGKISDSFLEIVQIQFNGEPALQFTINKDKLFDASIETTEEYSAAEYSSIQPHSVYELISRGINRAINSGQDSVLLNIQMDRFEQLKEDLGIAKAEKIAHSLVTFIVETFSHNLDCGRLSENCFIIVLTETEQDKALELADGLAHQISHDIFNVDDESFTLTTSIGVTLLNESVPSVERAIERSGQAIAELRDSHEIGNGAKCYVPDIHSNEISKAEAVVITARRLLDEGLFSIRYQPIVALISGGSGKEYYEVILGINQEVSPSELPEDFIYNLFKSDIAGEVDRWVILQALKSLTEKLKTNPETQLFINISAQSFSDEEFLPWLKTALKASQLPPNALIFQFREIDAVRFLNQAAAITEEMKKVNGQVSIGNFGLAINALKTLERVPVDFIKFDRLIVEKLQQGGEGKADFNKLMGGLTGSGTNIIVPFVEQASILPTLWQQGVQYIQGHYVKEPSFEMDFDFTDDN